MDIKDNCKVLLTNNKLQKVKCYKFLHEELGRELAVHEDVENKNITSITDVLTGFRLCYIHKEINKVKDEDIDQTLNQFIRHYTIEDIKKKFKEIENRDKKD